MVVGHIVPYLPSPQVREGHFQSGSEGQACRFLCISRRSCSSPTTATRQLSAFPWHEPGSLVRTTWWQNQGKRGGLTEVPLLVVAAIHARNAGLVHVLHAIETALRALRVREALRVVSLKRCQVKEEIINASRQVAEAFGDASTNV